MKKAEKLSRQASAVITVLSRSLSRCETPRKWRNSAVFEILSRELSRCPVPLVQVLSRLSRFLRSGTTGQHGKARQINSLKAVCRFGVCPGRFLPPLALCAGCGELLSGSETLKLLLDAMPQSAGASASGLARLLHDARLGRPFHDSLPARWEATGKRNSCRPRRCPQHTPDLPCGHRHGCSWAAPAKAAIEIRGTVASFMFLAS